ncbi:MAG: L-aspartate oxidase, partial [Agromyces sp.]
GLTDSATAWAQGGVAAALSDDDSPALHAADTMRASANLAEPRAVDVLVTEGPSLVHELAARGTQFDRDTNGHLARAREAAHSLARVVHAGGDATGREIERALAATLRASGLSFVEHTALVDLVLDRGRVVGATTIDSDGHRLEWSADAVVLATGGIGQVYRYTTNPPVATGDGLAAAIRAGAHVTDLEFVQFHPTALATPAVALISEAVRGDGAVLRNAAGERFMRTVHPDAELAPRDVVARAVAREMARDGQPVWLDATAIRPASENAAYLAERFPTIDAACRAAGFEWSQEWVPITPAAHYLMGGVESSVDGETSLPGLWAIGEVARTGVHGANRLASNSLLEAGVFARRAARAIDERSKLAAVASSSQVDLPIPLPKLTSAPVLDSELRTAVQALMWTHAGVERSEAGLRTALRHLEDWRASAPVSPVSIRASEDRNLLDVALGIVHAALERRESIGAHYRSESAPVQSSIEENQLARPSRH